MHYLPLCCNMSLRPGQGRNEGEHNSLGPKSLWGLRMTAGVQASPNNVTSTFFNTVNLLPKEIRFERRGAKLASCSGHHLTSLRPWGLVSPVLLQMTEEIWRLRPSPETDTSRTGDCGALNYMTSVASAPASIPIATQLHKKQRLNYNYVNMWKQLH